MGRRDGAGNEGNAPRWPKHEPRKDPSPQRAGARRRSPQRGSAAAGAHITREAGRCAPIGPLRRAADRVYVMRQGRPPPRGQGEYGGRRGCRGAGPSHPLPLAAQATQPGCRAEAATQRKIKKKKGETTKPRCRTEAASPNKKKRKKPPCPAGRPADGAADLVMRRFSILLNKSALGRGWGAWGEGEPLPRRRRPKGGPQGRAR